MPLLHPKDENDTGSAAGDLLHPLCQLQQTASCNAIKTVSRNNTRRDNERALELLAAAAEVNQAVRLAANPLRDGAAVPQRGPMVRGRRAWVW